MIDEKEMKEFLTKKSTPFVDPQFDANHLAEIKDVRIVEVSYGTNNKYKKLFVNLLLDTGEEKTISLSKTTVTDLTSGDKPLFPKNLNKWVGIKVKLVPMKVQIRGQLKDRLTLEPTE